MKKMVFKEIRILAAVLLLMSLIMSGCAADKKPDTSAITEKPGGIVTDAPGDTPTDMPTDGPTEEPAHKHTFGEWKTIKEPTCIEAGEQERSCECGEVERETLAAKGHEFVEGVCTRCGEKINGDVTGLEFALTEDGNGYTVTGIGTCKESMLSVPGTYNGKPVVEIGEKAFYECEQLTEVVLPSSVKKIGKRAFQSCINLRSIELPEGLEEIAASGLSFCASLSALTFPQSLRSVGEYGLYKNESLRELTIPKGLTELSRTALTRLTGLEKLTVEEGNPRFRSAGNCVIETAEKRLYAGCRTSVIPDDGSVDNIGGFAFYYCTPLTETVLPDTIVSIGSEAFEGCSGLTSITLSKNLKSIGFAAFRHCEGLTAVTLPDSIETIARESFRSCLNLEEIDLGSGLKTVERYAFQETKLKALNFPASVELIEPRAAGFCAELVTVTVAEGNPKYHSSGNCVIETESKTLVLGSNSTVIPDDGSVTSIAQEAFYVLSLTEITIPEGIESIGIEAFRGCRSLTTVNLPVSLKIVGGAAFTSCESLAAANYAGTSDQWTQVRVEIGNDELLAALKTK
ncbi:MAG: leucine-rich repeat protein [Clostridia bacterium]|nr:leucine-rich repeat protein [Clostridia bacterium]